MECDPSAFSQQSMYKLMIGAIVPRPIGWISTISPSGVANVAPFSFFNAVCSNPPTVLFCVTSRKGETPVKDTLHNVLTSGEFVVNIVTAPLAGAMNLTSANLPPEFSEFEYAGLEMAPSVTVKPPRVAASPVHFECVLDCTVPVNADAVGGATVVFGTVTHVHVDDAVLLGTDKIDPVKLQPVGRMAGMTYARIDTLFELERPVLPKVE